MGLWFYGFGQPTPAPGEFVSFFCFLFGCITLSGSVLRCTGNPRSHRMMADLGGVPTTGRWASDAGGLEADKAGAFPRCFCGEG